MVELFEASKGGPYGTNIRTVTDSFGLIPEPRVQVRRYWIANNDPRKILVPLVEQYIGFIR